MTLSIITINRNNAVGLEKTLRSVEAQTCRDFEHIIVDGASTDGSTEILRSLTSIPSPEGEESTEGWTTFQYAGDDGVSGYYISEPDGGIYNAMNKGIRRATGTYIQILNSGDCLAAPDVVERMKGSLSQSSKSFPSGGDLGEAPSLSPLGEGQGEASCRGEAPLILYGNMVKVFPDGHILRDKCFAGQPITMLGMYVGTLNHSPAWIRRDLFERFGFYDEMLKIVSDWKWYLQALVLGNGSAKPLSREEVKYMDFDVTLFDMTGISETNKLLDKLERRQVLEALVTPAILADYDRFVNDIDLAKRLHRHPWAFKVVRFLERVLFKKEKIQRKRRGESRYQ